METTTTPKKALQSKTINFNSLVAIGLGVLVSFNLINEETSSSITEVLTPEMISAITLIVGNIWLRFKTDSPVTLK